MNFDFQELISNWRIATGALILASLIFLYTLINIVSGFFVTHDYLPKSHVALKSTAQISIASQHLFGDFRAKLPMTALELSLQGVFLSSDLGQSSALISAHGAAAKLYHPGDSIGNGVILSHVLADRVLLQNSGKLELLALKREQLQFVTGSRDTIF